MARNLQNLRPFKKGQSGNPKGRPKKLPQLDKLMDEILGDEKKGITAAQAILARLRQKALNGDIKAAELLFDRAYGKPKQVIEDSGETRFVVEIVPAKKPSDG